MMLTKNTEVPTGSLYAPTSVYDLGKLENCGHLWRCCVTDVVLPDAASVLYLLSREKLHRVSLRDVYSNVYQICHFFSTAKLSTRGQLQISSIEDTFYICFIFIHILSTFKNFLKTSVFN